MYHHWDSSSGPLFFLSSHQPWKPKPDALTLGLGCAAVHENGPLPFIFPAVASSDAVLQLHPVWSSQGLFITSFPMGPSVSFQPPPATSSLEGRPFAYKDGRIIGAFMLYSPRGQRGAHGPTPDSSGTGGSPCHRVTWTPARQSGLFHSLKYILNTLYILPS